MFLFAIAIYYLMPMKVAIGAPQINLYMTNVESDYENKFVHQYNCLHVIIPVQNKNDTRQLLFYCMTAPPTWKIQNNTRDEAIPFAILHQHGITSWQLYSWSASMDVAETYEYYLKQMADSNQSSLADEVFYNCTDGRFGPICEYNFDDYRSHHATLNDIINDAYLNRPKTTTLTCYVHLQCDRGITSVCLDWSEICDGKIDCIDGGRDEENCWQLLLNECQSDEYRCENGQCIPRAFYRDDPGLFDCLDRSDELIPPFEKYKTCDTSHPIFSCEDITCSLDFRKNGQVFPKTCFPQRADYILNAIIADKPNFINDTCWLTYMCMIHAIDIFSVSCYHCFKIGSCEKIIRESCPNLTFIPRGPVFFGNIYFGYLNNESSFSRVDSVKPQYVCFKEPICNHLFTDNHLFLFGNLTCRRLHESHINFMIGRGYWTSSIIIPALASFWQCNPSLNYNTEVCNKTHLYQCLNTSKCIPMHRLHDSVVDCYNKDDEKFDNFKRTCTKEAHFQCLSSDRCIVSRYIQDGQCDCSYDRKKLCDDESIDVYESKQEISFQTVCDGVTELNPITIDGKNETDETNCEHYPCNNTYTRCNGIWNCMNGADEVDCETSPFIKCPTRHHVCVSSETNEFMCLPIEKANDGVIDCLGATDEPFLCREVTIHHVTDNFLCKGHSKTNCVAQSGLCNRLVACLQSDDERFCSFNSTFTSNVSTSFNANIQRFMYNYTMEKYKPHIVHFSLVSYHDDFNRMEMHNSKKLIEHEINVGTLLKREQHCNRGLPLRVWLHNEQNESTTTCLCPPTYYGDQCQYQNQRVSLTIAFKTFSDSWQTPFVILILLIDNSHERVIQSYEQLTYLPLHNCNVKFNLYLVYAKRPKHLHPTSYLIHMDVYEKKTLKYRGSSLFRLNHSFLPVHRLAIQLTIPRSSYKTDHCFDGQCQNGRCVKYLNDRDGTTFCQCNSGWSGRYCTISHKCSCSSDSVCVGHTASNRSLCVCPIGKFGPRCLLTSQMCQLSQHGSCLNGGQCIPIDEHNPFDRKFICLCPKHFAGDRCEIPYSKIVVSFHRDIILPQSMIVHFIQVIRNAPPNIANTLKRIPFIERTVDVHWAHPFHLVFIELENKEYYLLVVQKVYNRSVTHLVTLEPSKRCHHINMLFNATINRMHLLQRIKLYHTLCQRHEHALACFSDEVHLCVCYDHGEQRLANCFKFNHRSKHDCHGQSGCENGAQCFQDSQTCASTSMCVCPPCFYGTRCQFSTHGFALSLDAILGYHIRPYVSIRKQPPAVYVSLALSTLMILLGVINGLFSLVTFRRKAILRFGCGIYLLGTSITSLFTFVLLALKFWVLMLTQMKSISNRSFLYAQCILVDFFLRTALTMDQWLNACVSADRAMLTLKGVRFSQKQGKTVAKFITWSLLIFTLATAIHDPIHRQLIDDESEDGNKIWCITKYSSSLKAFDSALYIFHFSATFLINLISGLLIIFETTRQRASVRTTLSYRQNLFKQVRKHYNILVAPCALVLIGLPRLILTFVSGCMGSPRHAWLFLIGYFVSFIPSMLTFVLFVLPSTSYKTEFRSTIKGYRRISQSCWDRYGC